MKANGFVSLVHRKKPKGKPMPATTRRANGLKSKTRSRVEHVFAVTLRWRPPSAEVSDLA